MAKILKNVTALDIFLSDVGQVVPALSNLEISPSDYDKYAQSEETFSEISSGNIVLNDGENDLAIDDALDLIKGLFPLNYSYSKVLIKREIPDYQQMIVLRRIIIDDHLFIQGDGELVVI